MADLEAHTCPSCGIEWAAPKRFFEGRRATGATFYCPNGHTLHYGETEADRLRRERDRLAQQVAQRDDALRAERASRDEIQRQLSAQKGVTTRLKNRAAAGVCPCCNRTFKQLAAHMRQKHPTYMDAGTKELVQ
jgi:hypothetical protein